MLNERPFASNRDETSTLTFVCLENCDDGYARCQLPPPTRQCIPKTWTCDSDNDCGNNWDERVCGGGELIHSSINCLPSLCLVVYGASRCFSLIQQGRPSPFILLLSIYRLIGHGATVNFRYFAKFWSFWGKLSQSGWNPTPDCLRQKYRKKALYVRIISTDTKRHVMGFRLIPKSVTLNDLQRRNDRRRALSLR